MEGAASEHLGWLDRAVSAADETEDQEVKAAVLGDRAAVLLSLGDPKGWDAIDDIPRGGDLDTTRRWCVATSNLAVVVFFLGHYNRTQSFVSEGLRGIGGAFILPRDRAAREHTRADQMGDRAVG